MNYARSDDHVITVGLPLNVVVSNASNSGPGSLREAIETVDFYGTITFNLGKGDNNTGEQLDIDKDISIIGPEDEPVILSGNFSCRIFNIHGNRNPFFSNLTLVHGMADNGGAIYCSYGSGPILHNITIKSNKADYGGGIYSVGSNLTVLQNVFLIENEAYVGGGGLHLEYSNATLINVCIANNILTGGYIGGAAGGAMTCIHSNITLLNTTVAGNFGDSLSIFGDDSTNINIQNSILWNGGNEIECWDQGIPNSIVISFSDIEGGVMGITNNNGTVNLGDGIIYQDPLFFGSGDFPFSLSDGSPCIDEGNPDTTGLYLPCGDIIGNKRIWDGDGDGVAIIDIGAYEYGSIAVGLKEPLVQNVKCNIQNYPNPFVTSTLIEYKLQKSCKVEIKIYNQAGYLIEEVIKDEAQKGINKFTWQASNQPSGIYFIRLHVRRYIYNEKSN